MHPWLESARRKILLWMSVFLKSHDVFTPRVLEGFAMM